MKENDFKRIFVLIIMMVLSSITLQAQLFDVDVSEIQHTDHNNYINDPVSEFLSCPDNVEYVLSQFQRGDSRIVGGDDVDIEDYPWQVSLQFQPQFGGSHMCGGTIIDKEWILTAAHCLVIGDGSGGHIYLGPQHIRFRAGFTSMSSNQGTFYYPSEIHIYPDYNPNQFPYDIALVRLESEINLFEDTKAKVGFVRKEDADAGMTDPGEMVKISGWGSLSYQGPSPDILQAIEVPIVHVSNTNYNPQNITPDMILAGAPGKDSCQGDSGGPMVVEDGEGWYKVAGVVSWGVQCAIPAYPGVYARVSYFDKWISNLVENPDPNQFDILLYETFGDAVVPETWINEVVEGPDGFPGFEWTIQGGAYGGTLNSTTAHDGYLILNSVEHGHHSTDEEVHLITPPVDLTGVTNDVIFSVEHRARTFGNAAISIYISTDNFNTQTQLYNWQDAPQHQYNGENPVYSEYIINDIAQGESDVRFLFKWQGRKDYWWLLDDVRVAIEYPSMEVHFNVTDGQEPLPGVFVSTPYTGQEGFTDDDGAISMTMFAGEYDITAYKEGYFLYEENITISEDGQVVDIEMVFITYPELVIDVDAIEISIPQNRVDSTTVNFSNPGDGNLLFELFAYDANPDGKNSQTADKYCHDRDMDEVIEIHYDNGYSGNGVGTTGPSFFKAAARFTAEELTDYYDNYLLGAVKYHIRTDDFSELTVKIWEGGTGTTPGEEIYSADVTGEVIIEDWSTHILSNPISLEPGQEYWIGYAIQTTGGHPASVDHGPMVDNKGGWFFFSNVWQQLINVGNRDYNWNIRGLLYLAEEIEWLSFDPKSGVIEPETDLDINFIFDTHGLELGNHHSEVRIVNNAGATHLLPVTLLVEPSLSQVSFDVLDQDGAPVDNALITFDSQTNSPGDYHFYDIPEGMYEYMIEKEGYLTAQGYIMVGNLDLVVEIMLLSEDSDLIVLEVNIDDEFGDPVEDAFFYMDGFGGQTSDEEGNISWLLIPGNYDYTVSKYGFEPISDLLIITDDDVQQLDITMTYLRFFVALDVNLDEAGCVTGEGEYHYSQTANIVAEANTGYHFVHWFENDEIISTDADYEFIVTGDRNITGVFSINTYIITATSTGNGVINPSGETEVEYGHDAIFTITPSTGSYIDDVEVDGESIGPVDTFTFENVTEDGHTIHAIFAKHTYEVNITFEGNGTVDPSGIVIVEHGDNLALEMIPDENHQVADIIVNGNSVGAHDEYVLTNIADNMTVHVVFEPSLGIDDHDLSPEFVIFPNPATDAITVQSDMLISEIKIFSITGQLIKAVDVNNQYSSIDVSDLQTGLYLVTVSFGNSFRTQTLSIQ